MLLQFTATKVGHFFRLKQEKLTERWSTAEPITFSLSKKCLYAIWDHFGCVYMGSVACDLTCHQRVRTMTLVKSLGLFCKEVACLGDKWDRERQLRGPFARYGKLFDEMLFWAHRDGNLLKCLFARSMLLPAEREQFNAAMWDLDNEFLLNDFTDICLMTMAKHFFLKPKGENRKLFLSTLSRSKFYLLTYEWQDGGRGSWFVPDSEDSDLPDTE